MSNDPRCKDSPKNGHFKVSGFKHDGLGFVSG